jgi:hypothetical protein
MDGLKEQLDASCGVAALYCLAIVPSSSRVAAVDEKVLYYLAGLMLPARSSYVAGKTGVRALKFGWPGVMHLDGSILLG